MDPRLLRYYNTELQHVRDMGAEFAAAYPKIAGRLGLEGFECADPYVERLLEGFAFLAARVQLKLDAEFPRFTQHLLEAVYPQYLAPTPSMVVVQFSPDLTEGSLATGFSLPRDTVLRSVMGKGDRTACEYRSAHDITLWPLELIQAEYLPYAGDAVALNGNGLAKSSAAVRLRLRSTAGLTFDKLSLDTLPLYLRGSDGVPQRLYELLLGHVAAMVIRPANAPAAWQQVVGREHVRALGFDDGQALLPYTRRSFGGYRLLQEYFAFPARFMFVELGGLAAALRRCRESTVDIVLLLERPDATLERSLHAGHFALFCTPAVNVFPKRADRIHLNTRDVEYHVVPDRTRPLDFEIHQVTAVTGYGAGSNSEQSFLPLYACDDFSAQSVQRRYYTCRRERRAASERQHRHGLRSSYVGSEVFVSLVDAAEAPYQSDLKQLGVTCLCSNRDLPLHISLGQGKTDFTLDMSAPVASVRCVAGPSQPRSSPAEGDVTWRLISQLSLNYLSLTDSDERQGAVALRELLALHGEAGDPAVAKQIDGVRAVRSRAVIRQIPGDGPLAFGRGVEVTLHCDDAAFEGTGVFLLSAVLERFFARHASINSFTETVVLTPTRGEVMRWPARIGLQALL
jgi:type VI secretion system protein ImpG